MLNAFVEDRHRKNSEKLDTLREPGATNSLNTLFFDTNYVPYNENTDDEKNSFVEKLPDILDGIKMTTSNYNLSTGIRTIYTLIIDSIYVISY